MKNIFYIMTMMEIMMVLSSAPALLYAEEPSSPKDWSVSSVSEEPKLEITVRGYPDTIQFGDSIYLICNFTNAGERVIDDIMVTLTYHPQFHDFRSQLVHDEEGNNYCLLPEMIGISPGHGPPPTNSLHPGESHVVYAHSFEVPPLEDIHVEFWKSLKADSSDDGREYTLQMSTEPQGDGSTILDRTFTTHIRIKPRSDVEMALLDSWLSQSTERNLPMVRTSGGAWYKYPYTAYQYRPRFSEYNDNNIIVDGKGQVKGFVGHL